MNASFLFVLLLGVLAVTADLPCCRPCRFSFCYPDGFMIFGKADILLHGPGYTRSAFVCRNFAGGRTLGKIHTTGEAIVEPPPGIGGTRISKFGRNGLSPAFPKNYFRLMPLPFQPNLQGVARRAPEGNQDELLADERSIRIPILHYDIQNANRSVFQTISASDSADCVSFLAVVRPIVVDVAWDSSDSLNLSVQGPRRSRRKRKSEKPLSWCGGILTGKETVSFTEMVPGIYTVRLVHIKNCFNKRTRWVLNIVVNGETIIRRFGQSEVDGRTLLELDFTI